MSNKTQSNIVQKGVTEAVATVNTHYPWISVLKVLLVAISAFGAWLHIKSGLD